MTILRFVAVMALAVWIGGLVALGGIGAPTIFDWLQAHDPAGGREMAGRLFGAIFARFQQVSWGLAGLTLLSLTIRAILGPRPRRFGIRMWVGAAMLAASLATALVVTPHLERIRDGVPGTVAALPDNDARKITFGRLHGLSNVLMLATIAAGLGLLWMEGGDRDNR